jgi:hypothetical protein
MSRTIEAIMEKSAPVNHHAIRVHAKRVRAIWQSGLETGGHVQRKLRLVFTMAAHQQV